MRQRAMIAMALSCTPTLLIADEPTTALDVTTEAQILDLMRDLQSQIGTSIMFVTHNMGVVAQMCDEVAVMYLGRVVERATVDDIFYDPKHPYTVSLLRSIPRLGARRHERLESIKGSIPDPYSSVTGCPFHPRCPAFIPGLCDTVMPEETLSLETCTIRYAATCIPAARRAAASAYRAAVLMSMGPANSAGGRHGDVPRRRAVERRISADARRLYTRGCK